MLKRKQLGLLVGIPILIIAIWVGYVFLKLYLTRDLITGYEPYSFTHVTQGYVEARGVWAFEDGTYAHTSTDLVCVQSDNACYEADAKFMNGTLLSDQTFFEVKSWDDNQVIADDSALCATDEIVVDFKTKTVVQTNTATDRTGICADFTSKYPEHSHLDSGMKVFYPSYKDPKEN